VHPLKRDPYSRPQPRVDDARGQFERTCLEQDVGARELDALWQLHVGDSRRAGWPLEALLADHAAWREFRRARSGDAAAAESFHSRWTRYISKYAEGRFGRDEIGEIASRFFERTWRLVDDNFRWQCPFGIYLRAVLVNLVRDVQSAAVVTRQREEPLAAAAEMADDEGLPGGRRGPPSPQAALMARDRSEVLAGALARLSPSDRRVIEAMLVEGCDGAALARELGMKRQAVYQRLHRAKQRLRLLLGEGARPTETGREPLGASIEES
jgi:RNA polymerase sigma factor (sigma-70 family)